ncbi:MAG: peptidoglycan editing factor PgeF [Gammaproteobacteria bacterium]
MPRASFITPNWPAAPWIKAYTTTRYAGGTSLAPYDGLNLAAHAGDIPAVVNANREFVKQALAIPSEPAWLAQPHGAQVIDPGTDDGRTADGACTRNPNTVCVVMTADCLPILICDRAGTQVAGLHGGWRGLAGGIIDAGLERMQCKAGEILAWLGPAISARHYEVDAPVRDQVLARYSSCHQAFEASRAGHWFFDLYAAARTLLASGGVEAVYGGAFCTYAEPERFFSYRRDGVTGRMASFIWIDKIRNQSQMLAERMA